MNLSKAHQVRKVNLLKPKKVKRSTLKKKAWAEFSRYIRKSHADELGWVKCYTCGNTGLWNKFQAGHGIGGRNNAVLFMEEVVRVQCVGCNVFGRGQYRIFKRKLIEELGIDEYDRLVKESNKVVQFKEKDFIELEKKYTALTKEVLREKTI